MILAVLMGTRDHFAKLFNDDIQVVRLTAEVLPRVALFQIADGLNGSCGGSLRGMGRQPCGRAGQPGQLLRWRTAVGRLAGVSWLGIAGTMGRTVYCIVPGGDAGMGDCGAEQLGSRGG